jgi:hypothetical protein
LSGRTRTNKVVNFEGPAELIGSFVNVEIVTANPWALRGMLSQASGSQVLREQSIFLNQALTEGNHANGPSVEGWEDSAKEPARNPQKEGKRVPLPAMISAGECCGGSCNSEPLIKVGSPEHETS